MSDASGLVQKLWNYCNVLRDDGVSYGDYVEQLTYLLFLKMADEQHRAPASASVVPTGSTGRRCSTVTATSSRSHYRHILDRSASSRACSARSSARRRTGSRTRPSSAG